MLKKLGELLKNKTHVKTIGVIAVINVILAFLALFKDIFLASYIGTSIEADAFLLAFFITDMIANNLIASALGACCIPFFSGAYVKKNFKDLKKRFAAVNLLFFIIMFLITVLIIVFQHYIINFLGNGFPEKTKILCMELLYILLPTMIIYPLVAVGASFLQIYGKFTQAAVSSLLFNLIFLIALIIFAMLKIAVNIGVYYIAFSVVCSVMIMLIFVYIHVHYCKIPIKNKFLYLNKRSLLKDYCNYIKEIFSIFLPYFFMLLFTQLITYLERYLASNNGNGSVAALNYAYRVAQFPIWVFAAAIGAVIFPMMSKLNNKENKEESIKILLKSTWIMVVITFPMMIMFFNLRVPIIDILFKRGAFTDISVKCTSDILSGYSMYMLGQGVVILFLKYYLSIGKIKKPLVILFSSFLLNIVFDVFFIKKIGVTALGYGAALSNSISAFLLYNNLKPGWFKTASCKNIFKLLCANFPLLIFSYICLFIWNYFQIDINIFRKLIFSITVSLISISLYLILIKKLKIIRL